MAPLLHKNKYNRKGGFVDENVSKENFLRLFKYVDGNFTMDDIAEIEMYDYCKLYRL